MSSKITNDERIEGIKACEESRKLRSNLLFIRNRIYWRELRSLQRERAQDSRFLLTYFREKLQMMKELNTQWKAMDYKIRQRTEPQLKIQNHKHSIGVFTSSLLLEMENSFLKISSEVIDFFEKEVIIPYEEKIIQHEKDLKILWEEGRKLLIGFNLMDNRVSAYYARLISAFSLPETMEVSNDTWLLQMKYSEATKRFLRISDDCNRQFRVLFNLAKQVEVNRVNLTLRTAEKFLSQFAEALSFAGIQNKGASDKILAYIEAMGNGQKAFSEELNRRVNEDTVEKGNFAAFATFELEKETKIHFLSSDSLDNEAEINKVGSEKMENHHKSAVSSSNFHLPTILDCAEMKKVFFFFREEPGLLLASWTPVIVVVTTTGWIHIFKVPLSSTAEIKSVEQAYHIFASSSKFLFEDDINRPVDPSLSVNENKIKYVNTSFQGGVGLLTPDDVDVAPIESFSKIADSLFTTDSFLEPWDSLLMKNTSVSMKPNPIATETSVTVTETTLYSTFTSFIFGDWTNEKKFNLKARHPKELIDFVSLFS